MFKSGVFLLEMAGGITETGEPYSPFVSITFDQVAVHGVDTD